MSRSSMYPPTISTRFPTDFCLGYARQSENLLNQDHPAHLLSHGFMENPELAGKQRAMGTSPSEPEQNTTGISTSGSATLLPTNESSTQFFGAVQFDVLMDHWKRWCIVENDGSVAYIPQWDHPSRYPGLAAAAKQGLAAGKLWLHGSHAWTDDGRPFVCSGFCFHARYFITAVHYLLDVASDERQDPVEKMKDPTTARIAISVAQKSEQPDKYMDDPSLRYAYLVSENVALDVAIFRIKDGEKDWEHSIELDQLAPAADHAWSHVFSVGYAGDCQGKKMKEAWNTYCQHIPGLLQGHQDRSLTQRFQDLVAKEKIPSYEDMFLVNRRAIATGHILDIPAGPRNNDDDDIHHTIPGWYGISGSMIGVLRQGLKVQIVGLFKGARIDELDNRLVPFTPAIIKGIKDAVGYTAEGSGCL